MIDPIVAVYPDYRGAATATGFDRLLAQVDGTWPIHPIAAINGHDEQAPVPTSAGTRQVHTAPGFNSAVLGGLHAALDLPATAIVRLDTAEHDPLLIPTLVNALCDRDADVVIADLVFDRHTLIDGTSDAYHNEHVMPLLLDHLTDGRLRLSGAHGYMAFRPAALTHVLPIVTAAWEATGPSPQRRVQWAADTELAIMAARLGLKVEVIEVPAILLRNRPAEKAARQLADTLALHAAATTVLMNGASHRTPQATPSPQSSNGLRDRLVQSDDLTDRGRRERREHAGCAPSATATPRAPSR